MTIRPGTPKDLASGSWDLDAWVINSTAYGWVRHDGDVPVYHHTGCHTLRDANPDHVIPVPSTEVYDAWIAELALRREGRWENDFCGQVSGCARSRRRR